MSRNLFDLSGRVAVVTGGTTGIGHAISLGLAEAGADVVASSRRAEQVEKTASEIEALGRRTLRVQSDVLDRSSVESLHNAVIGAFGKVDILVNAAGVTYKAPTLETQEADWSRVIETNLTGTLRACQIFGKTMVKAGYGRIINIASLTTFVGVFPGSGVFGVEGGCGIADQGARGGTGEDRRECECDCAGNVSHGFEREADHRHSARRGTAHARADGAVRKRNRTCRHGNLSGVGGGVVRDGRNCCGRRRLSGERG